MTSQSCLLALFVLGACAVDVETSEIQQAAASCPGCGGNGFSEAGYNYMFGQFDRNALKTAGAWNDSTDAPLTFCRPNTVTSTSCKLRFVYGKWLREGRKSIRVHIMTNVVKLIAPRNFFIHDDYDTSGNSYEGMFEIAPDARNASGGYIDYANQERISAGLLALLNAVSGVPICLQTEDLPTHCAGSEAYWHESTVYGKHFRHAYVAIAGGQHAPDPNLNKRYGTAITAEATEVRLWYGGAKGFACDHTGSKESRYSIRCRAEDNSVWNNPVTVLTPFDPDDFYYGPDSEPIERPVFVY